MSATAPTLPKGPPPPDQQLDPKVPVEPSPQEAQAIQAAEENPDKSILYIKRCGYGNMKFLKTDAKGEPVYFIEVAKKFVGWDITIRRGDKSGQPILHLKKAVRWQSLLGWDKGTKIHIRDKADPGTTSSSSRTSRSDDGSRGLDASGKSPITRPETAIADEDETEEQTEDLVDAPPELNPSHPKGDEETARLGPEDNNELSNELTNSMKQLNVKDPAELPAIVLRRKHAFRSNRNVFEHNGHTYAWDYMIFLGAKHTLTNLDTGEVIAICQLKAGVSTQSITAWGLRQNGCLEIIGSGLQMQDTIVATLIGMLEWRKHNNKVWIILLAALPV